MRFLSVDSENLDVGLSGLGVALTIGNFDGVHNGHQAMIRAMVLQAHQRNLVPVVMLFEPQPMEYFKKNQAPPRIMSLRSKLLRLISLRVRHIACVSFCKSLSEQPAEQFVSNFLINKLNTKYILIGEDFRFGHKRAGDINKLRQLSELYQFDVDTFNTVEYEQQKISSTLVRQLIQNSDFVKAEQMTGKLFHLEGKVGYGSQWARTINVPTANIAIKHQPLLVRGIYAVEARIEGEFYYRQAVASIGFRPTISDDLAPILEVHIFDYNGDLYGKRLKVKFYHKLRNEEKFESLDLMTQQIHQDLDDARTFFRTTLANKVVV